jgi:predicted phage tail protein
MIQIIFIKNILDKESREKKVVPFDRDKTVCQYLEESGFDYKNSKVIITGERKTDLDIKLKNFDEVLVVSQLEFAAIAVWWAAATFWQGVVFVLSILATAYSIYSALTARQNKPSFGSSTDDTSSPTYGWDGIANTQSAGLAISVIYGTHRIGGQIINQYVTGDGTSEYLNMLIALCEGEIEGISSIEINQNPIANFSNVVTATRMGTNTQTQIPGFEQLHSPYPQTSMLTYNNTITYTTSNTAVQELDLKLNFPNGIYSVDDQGNVNSWGASFNIQHRVHGTSPWTDDGSFSASGLSRSQFYKIFKLQNLSAAQYDIKITRTSSDSTISPVNMADCQLAEIDEIIYEDLSYPNIALLSLNLLATDQISGATPTVTCVVKGKKVSVPDIRNGGTAVAWEDYYYDPATEQYKLFSDGTVLSWDGVTYVTAFSANPVWCVKDLLTNNTYGLGNYIQTTMMTASEWLEMAQYCDNRVSDGLGGYEKRFELDIVLDSQKKALDWLSEICSTFRAFTFYSCGMIKIKIDKPDVPVQVFGMGNIIDRGFTETWKSLKERYNTIEIQYVDKDEDYANEVAQVIDEDSYAQGLPIRKRQIRLYVTRISQIIREGKYALNIAKHINRTITLQAGIDAVACQAGDLISVAHDVPQWGFSGRVKAGSSSNTVVLDQTLTIASGKSYQVTVRHADDSIETKNVTNGSGTASTLTISGSWTTTPSAYDVYAFGEVNVLTKPFRIVSIKRAADDTVQLDCIEYNEDVYDTDTIDLPDNNYSELIYALSNVNSLALTERLIKASDGTIQDCIDVWFNRPSASQNVIVYDHADIYLSDNSGTSWTYKGSTKGGHFAISEGLVDGVDYKVAVVSVGFNGKINSLTNSPSQTIHLIGKSAPPSDVETFLVNQNLTVLSFGWTTVDDLDFDHYEIRCGQSWESGIVIATQLKSSTYILHNFSIGADQSFYIKAVDTSGNYSTTAKEAIITISNIPFQNIIASYAEGTSFSGTKSNLTVVGSHLEISTGHLSGTYTTPVRDNGFVALFNLNIVGVVTIAGSETWQDFGTETFQDVSPSLRFSGSEIQGSASYEINISNDNVTWSGWKPFQPGGYNCRYFQIRLTLTRQSTGQDLQCSQFDYTADLPDVDEIDEATISTASSGVNVTFTKTFHQLPAINVNILNGSGIYFKQSSLTDTGVNIKLYDLTGTPQTGDIRLAAHGV